MHGKCTQEHLDTTNRYRNSNNSRCLKLIYDSAQKIFNPNKRQFSISNSTWFNKTQDGNIHKTQTIEIHAPQLVQLPTQLTINFKRLTRQEQDAEFEQGAVLFFVGLVGTLGGAYCLCQKY